jgi:hypothetical protein
MLAMFVPKVTDIQLMKRVVDCFAISVSRGERSIMGVKGGAEVAGSKTSHDDDAL